MKNLSNKILCLFLIFSLFACSPGTGLPIPSETPQAQPTVTEAKSFATETFDVTPTVPSPTGAALPTATSAASLAEAHLTIKCLDISPALPENADLSGKLILFREFINGKGFTADGDAIMDLQTRTLTPIEEGVVSISVSPDRERLAYFYAHHGADGKRDAVTLIIKNMDGKVLAKVPGDVDNWDGFYWLDNKRVVITLYNQPLVLNPFTREHYDLSKWYAQSPGGLKTTPVWGVNGVFDSQLSRLFYIQEDDTMLLWDLKSKKILAKLTPTITYGPKHPTIYAPYDQPKWLWDDSQIILAYSPSDALNPSDEFYGVNRNGQITQLTYLSKYYPEVAIKNFSLSPDGRLVAFFFIDISNKEKLEQLAILDLATLKVTNYCTPNGSTPWAGRPVWSPDGQKLLIERMEADQSVKTILIDLVTEYAVPLVDNLMPADWMKAPKP
jgi:hypothetical protein